MNTRKRILQAFCLLTQEVGADKITMDMLAERSEVSKSTFYRLFRNKHEVMNAYYCENVERIFGNSEAEGWSIFSERVLGFVYENRSFFSNAFKEGAFMSDSILRHAIHSMQVRYLKKSGRGSLPADIDLLMRIYSAGTVDLVEKWLRGEMDYTCVELSRCLCDGIPEPLARYL
jgi:AcrR family transcriptional regulator